jgi:uroporphyrinogen decarboxylase
MNKLDQIILDSRLPTAPFLALPGLQKLPFNISQALQNSNLHYKLIHTNYTLLQPDVVFPIMDLSLEASAYGKKVAFKNDKHPIIIDSNESILTKCFSTNILDNQRIKNYLQTIKLMNDKLPKTVIKAAYVTAPFTLATLLLGFKETKKEVEKNSDNLENLMQFCTQKTIEFMQELKYNGAELLCFLDPSASLLQPDFFLKYSKNFLSKIGDACNDLKLISILHICGKTNKLIDQIVNSNFSGISLDSAEIGINLEAVAKLIPKDIYLFGNISPTGTILSGTITEVKQEVKNLLSKVEKTKNFVLSTACDLPKDVPLENIYAFICQAKNYNVGRMDKRKER